jgi:sugar O-acyltransferase (sialic acid O-acetyltransferase NeuD family)
MIKSEIIVPLLNANEPEARLVKIHVKDGEPVKKGRLLFTIETTKAAADIEAQADGYLRVEAKEGDLLGVGDRLGDITDEPNEKAEERTRTKMAESKNEPGALRITKPARALAEELGVDLEMLPVGRLITEETIRQYAQAPATEINLPDAGKPYIMIYGAGGHAKTIMEMVRQLATYSIAGIVDDNQALTGTHVLDIPVLGTRMLLPALFEKGVRLAANGVGGIVDINVRVKVFELLAKAGFSFPVLIHPRATVEPTARIEAGVQVFANAYVGTEAVLHEKCMVNTNAVVSHDCVIGAYTHIAPGALLAGHVHVGAQTLLGMGVTTAIGVKIGAGVRVGNGAILLADVPDRTIIQAGRFWTGIA